MEFKSFSRCLKTAIAVGAMALSFVAAAASFQAQVVRVADGDTITVVGPNGKNVRIRFLGIDAPESQMPYGKKSQRSLEALIRSANHQVTIVYEKRDAYDRIVGKVIANGQDINLEQVRRGLAWVYRNYLKDVAPRDRELYIEAERQAKSRRVGLWADNHPQEPWEWRRNHRRKDSQMGRHW